ncbi:MAG: N-acetylmuramoyl-L-alanine amidase [Clostridiales bacterium]|nr:N-acetylmuramoyl-L-alanine amidase [Clostridiales bacterium]
MKKKYYNILFLILVYMACILTSKKSVEALKNIMNRNVRNPFANSKLAENNNKRDPVVIVIDPGHGGRDPGKVGVNNSLEKDINLSIALKLRDLLEANDVTVIMTREEDVGLYSESDTNKKRADLNKRIEIIHANNADFSISIHQNSFQEEYVKGAQTFYHKQSEEGKKLAEIIMDKLKQTINDDNHRVAKSNESYYMLKYTKTPLVIVECGYMSNYNEAALLIDDEYQNKLAWGIHLGIMEYINTEL